MFAPPPSDPIEELNEVELIEEVVLVPQHELIVAGIVIDNGAPRTQVVRDFVRRWTVTRVRGELPRPHIDQFRVAQITRYGAFVQWISPD